MKRVTRTYFKPLSVHKAFYGGKDRGFYLKQDGPRSFWLCHGTENGSSATRITATTYKLLCQACKTERLYWREKMNKGRV